MKKRIFLLLFIIAHLFLFASDYPVINEVLHNAPYDEKWIEIYNPSPYPYPLNGWKLQIGTPHFETIFTFPNITLLPGEYIVIGENNIDFADYNIILNLTNSEIVCGVRLTNPNENYKDTILYGYINTYNLPDDIDEVATSFVNPAAEGHSLARNPNGHDTNNISDWDMAERPTPRFENFLYYDLSINDLYITTLSDIHILNIVIHDLSTLIVDMSLIVLSILLNDIDIYSATPNIMFINDIATFEYPINLLESSVNIIEVKISYPHDVDNSNNSKRIEFWHGNKPIIINELQFAPIAPEPEWIEFFNPNNEAVFLENAYFTDSAGRISVFSAYLEPGDYFLVTQNINNLLVIHPHLDLNKIFQPSSWAILVNTRDTVELFYQNEVKIDSVSYVGVNSMRGRSLERVNPWTENDIQWVFSTDENGSTPLAKNSQTPAELDLEISSVSIIKGDNNLWHIVEIKNKGYIDNFEGQLLIYSKNETEVDYSLLDEIYIYEAGEIDYFSIIPIIKGYHYFMYKLLYEKETNVAFSSLLNERPPVVVNEIMFYPNTSEPIWIEFIKTREAMPYKGLNFFARTDSMFIPFFEGEFALLARNSSDSLYIRENYDVPENVPIFLGLRSLLVAGMNLVIKDYDNNLYEGFSYKQNYSLIRGISAERISPLLPPEDQNWVASLQIATPGRRNSVLMEAIPATSSFEIDNNPFSPYRNEHCLIKVSVTEQQVRADITIFDIKGREIIKLADKMVIPGEYVFIWGGFDRNNKAVSPGVYPVYVNIESLGGGGLLQTRKVIYVGH